MSITTFPVSGINVLRRRVQRVARPSASSPEGWSISTVDPMETLAVFKTLRMKPGYALRAYQFRSRGDGNGVVWAMPLQDELLAPDDCPRLEDVFLSPPKPTTAMNDVMQAIDGDGSPFSFLSASVLARELAEFGAMWHGTSWGEDTIVGRKPSARLTTWSRWTWKTPIPTDWLPRVSQSGERTEVSFYVFSQLGTETLTRVTDSFDAQSYSFTTIVKEIAAGGFGKVL